MSHLLLRALLLAVIGLLASPAAAFADPAVPTNWRSQVTSLDPPVDGVTAEVVGGDAFLRVEVEPGVSATAFGYASEEDEAGEPYVRFLPDGTVEENRGSVAYFQNADRYGPSEPVEATGGEDWEVVARDGSYAWHDHRIHWMSPTLPPGPRDDPGTQQITDEWSVPLDVNGERVLIRGQLEWHPDVSPLPAWLVGAAVAVVTLLGVRARGWLVAATTALAATVVAGVLAAGELRGTVDTGLGSWIGVAFAALGVLTGLAALAIRRSRPDEAHRLTIAAAGFAVVFAVQRVGGLSEPILPSALPDPVVRYGIVVALGAAAGAALGLLTLTRRPAVTPSSATSGEATA